MALDTAKRRSSAINVGSPWRGLLPTPDGVIDQADRQSLAFLYSGISAAEQVAAPPAEEAIAVLRIADAPFVRADHWRWTPARLPAFEPDPIHGRAAAVVPDLLASARGTVSVAGGALVSVPKFTAQGHGDVFVLGRVEIALGRPFAVTAAMVGVAGGAVGMIGAPVSRMDVVHQSFTDEEELILALAA